MTYVRIHKIRCYNCRRPLAPGDQYHMIRGEISCKNPECIAKTHSRGKDGVK